MERLGLRRRNAYFECHYEQFCDDPKAVIKDVLIFLGRDGDVADLGEPVVSMNHKFKDSVSTQLLKRMEARLAEALPPQGYQHHADEWEQRLGNYR